MDENRRITKAPVTRSEGLRAYLEHMRGLADVATASHLVDENKKKKIRKYMEDVERHSAEIIRSLEDLLGPKEGLYEYIRGEIWGLLGAAFTLGGETTISETSGKFFQNNQTKLMRAAPKPKKEGRAKAILEVLTEVMKSPPPWKVDNYDKTAESILTDVKSGLEKRGERGLGKRMIGRYLTDLQ